MVRVLFSVSGDAPDTTQTKAGGTPAQLRRTYPYKINQSTLPYYRLVKCLSQYLLQDMN